MSVSQASGRFATVAIEARRQKFVALVTERLCMVMLAGATLYLLIGDGPFGSRDPNGSATPDHSAEVSPINRWIWLSLAAMAIPVLWVRRAAVVDLLRANWPMLLLFGWFGLTTTWALDPDASVRRVVLYDVQLAVFTAVTVGLRRPHLAHLILLVCTGLVLLTDLASWPVVPHIAMTVLGFAGMHPQKNVTGEIALLGCLATATYLPFSKGRGRAALWALLVAEIVVLVVTRSTTSQSLAIAALVVMPIVVKVLRCSRHVIAAAAGVLVLGVAAALFLYLAWAGLTGADPMAPLSQVTFTERTDLWKFLVENIRLRPLQGAGFGSFWAIDPAVQPSLQTGEWFAIGMDVANQGHNAYLDIAATTGLIGLALVLVTVLRAIFHAGRGVAHGASPFPLAFLLVLVVHSFTESSLFTANSILGSFFVLIAIQLAMGPKATGFAPWPETTPAR